MTFLAFIYFLLRTYSTIIFPERNKVIVHEFASFENFFPIATLDLTDKGIKDEIHIIYLSFNYSGPPHDPNFPEGEDMDHYTYKITKNGLYRPTFNKDALVIDPNYQPYFDKGRELFSDAKTSKRNIDSILKFKRNPDWLQNDATPYNSKKEPYTFICQFEMEGLFSEDSWVYVFYDKTDHMVKYVHQRT